MEMVTDYSALARIRVNIKYVYSSVSQNFPRIFLLPEPLWLQKIITHPHILVYPNIEHPYVR